MAIPQKFREALSQEFSCFYEVSEQPSSWDDWLENELEEESSIGAARLRYWIDDRDIAELVEFLRTQSEERNGELVREIENWTNSFWSHDDRKWKALQQILTSIADQLEALAENRASQ